MVKRKNNDKSSWVRAYSSIKDAIESGELEMGTPLSENYLAERIGVSRTPIREALRFLEQDGFVTIVPTKGAFVSEISLEDIKEIYDIRKLLEPFASLSAVSRVPEEEINTMEKGWNEIKKMVDDDTCIEWSQISDMDYHLHFTIIRHSVNKRVSAILSSYHSQIKRFQILSAQSLADVKSTINQHVDLLECLKERNSKKFAERLYEHIVKSEENILKDYFIEKFF